MYKSILVPFDGSTFAEHALPAAAAIARRIGASLLLARVHVPLRAIYTEGVLFFDEEMDAHFKEQDRASLDTAAKKVKDSYHDLSVTTKLLEGEIADAVAAEVTDSGHDLVVMTTHGRGTIGRFLLGSVADQLLRQVPIPLLLIHPPERSVDFSKALKVANILVPLDGSELAEQILEPASTFSKALGANLILTQTIKPLLPPDYPPEMSSVFHSVEAVLKRIDEIQKELREKAQLYLDGVAERLRAEGLSVQTRIDEHRQPAAAILDEIKDQQIDMIALATHARHGLPRLFLGSVANKVIRGSAIPVLVQRPQ